jgi:hypothetical protein
MARDFPGSAGNYLSLTNPVTALDLTAANISMSVWVKLDSITGSRPFVAKRNGSGIQYLFRIKTGTGGKVSFFIGGSELLSAASLSTGVWTHLCVSKAGTGANTTKLYINGSLDSQANVSNPPDTNADFTLGFDSVEAALLDGQMQDVAIWTAALTADEAAALAKGGSPQMIQRASLIAHYPMWGISSAGEEDVSGNGQNVSEVGTVAVGATPAPVGPFVLT